MTDTGTNDLLAGAAAQGSDYALQRYLEENPGTTCWNCGASWETCTERVLRSADGSCCGACYSMDTHRAEEMKREKLRRDSYSRCVSVPREVLAEMARKLRSDDPIVVRQVAEELMKTWAYPPSPLFTESGE